MNRPEDAYDDVVYLAADPDTDWETLHWIAEDYPELRPLIATNPGAYDELVEALATLGDPEIDAAISARRAAEGRPDEDSAGEAYAGAVPETVAASGGPGDSGGDFPGGSAAGVTPPSASVAGAPGSPSGPEGAAGNDRPTRSRSKAGVVLLAVVLPLVALVAVGALLWNLIADRPAPDAGPDSPADVPAPGEEEEPEGEEPPVPDEDSGLSDPGVTAQEALGSLESLAVDSSCEAPEEDAEVVSTFIHAALWEDTGDIEAPVESSLEELQEECSSTHAAAVYQVLRADDSAEEEVREPVLSISTDWADQLVEAPSDAQEMSSFVTPDENIQCVLEDGVRCTVFEHEYAAPEGCEEGTTYSMQVDGDPGPDCENPVPDEDRDTLDHDETATDGFLACVSLEDRVSCFNTLTGEGFEMSERGHYPYSM